MGIKAGFIKAAMKALSPEQKKQLAEKIVEQLRNQINELKQQTEGLFEIEFTVSEKMIITIVLTPNF